MHWTLMIAVFQLEEGSTVVHAGSLSRFTGAPVTYPYPLLFIKSVLFMHVKMIRCPPQSPNIDSV